MDPDLQLCFIMLIRRNSEDKRLVNAKNNSTIFSIRSHIYLFIYLQQGASEAAA